MKRTHVVFPRAFHFGPEVLWKVLPTLHTLGARVGVVTGRRWARESGTLDRVVHILKEAGLTVRVAEGVPTNPDREDVHRIRDAFQAGVDWLLALGGGSVMDATKAAALALSSGRDIWDYVYEPGKSLPDLPAHLLPVVAVPTVAGSGSESDGAAVLNHRAQRRKLFLSFPELTPQVVLMDPTLYVSLRPYQTALGAVDIFCQFLEPLVMFQHPFSLAERLSLTALQEVMERAREVMLYPDRLELRASLALLSTLSMNRWGRMGTGGTLSLHWLEHALSGFYPEIAHPQGLASLLPAYLHHQVSHCPDIWEPLALALTGSRDPEALIRTVVRWLTDLGVARSLRELGVREEDLDPMTDQALQDYGWDEGRIPGPHPMDREAVLSIYRRALGGVDFPGKSSG